MGVMFSVNDGLTDNQKKAAELMGITNDDMYNRLKRINDKDFYDVSIVIPVYNGEKYILESINSAKNQTWKSTEVIVINDGSTDGTHEICKQIDGISYYMKPNGGTASALNTGIKFAHGLWIKWLSADDVLYPDTVEKMMTYPPLNKEVIYYTHYDYIDENGKIKGSFVEPDRSDKSIKELKEEMLGNFFGNGSTSLIHRDIFKKIGMFDRLPHSEDYDFWLKALSNGIKMELMDMYSCKYRLHSEQLTNKIGGQLNDYIRSRYG